MALVIFVWCLNLGISIWNAYAVGSSWVEAKHAGGGRRFIVWMGAIMTDIGFTWCSLILIGWLLNSIGYLNDYSLRILLDAGYVLIIPFLLVAGWAITIYSWQQAYRKRTLANVGVASWNTFASIHNTYSAVNSFGDALGEVFDAFTGKGRKNSSNNSNDAQGLLIILILVVSIGLGTMITYGLIQYFAGRDEPLPDYENRYRYSHAR